MVAAAAIDDQQFPVAAEQRGEAVLARDQDERRISAYVEQCIEKFFGFQIPVLGEKKRRQARAAMTNFARNPRTQLYENMVKRTDTYRVSLFQNVG